MVGNKINSLFVCHYLYENYEVDYDCEKIVYSMNVVDHNVNVVSLTEKDCLVFSKEKYAIETVVDQTDENESEDVDDDMPELEEIDEIVHFRKEIEELKMELKEMIEHEVVETIVTEPVVTEPLLEPVIEPIYASDTSEYEIVEETPEKE
jgi:hypothetical protein